MAIGVLPKTPVARFDVPLRPAAMAQVFVGAGLGHQSIAVPGVVLCAGEVLVEIELATICGSDVHTVLGHRPTPTPSVLGHEYVGRVVAIGSETIRCVDGSTLRIGDRIVWSIFAACHACDRCARGLPQKCRELIKYGHERIAQRWELNGGFATHAHLRPGTVIARVPEALPAAALAPAACGTATAAAAVRAIAELGDLEESLILVSGAGLIGLSVAAMASDEGARVLVSDPDPARRELARRFGATAAVDPRENNAVTLAVAELGARELTAAVEASGSRAAVQHSLGVVGVGATVVLVGSVFETEPIEIDPQDIVRRCLTIRGVHNYQPADLGRAVTFLRERHARYPFAGLVTETYALDDIDQALERAATGGAVRVGVLPHDARLK